MSLVIGKEDEFEANYTARFLSLANPYGIPIKYEQDRVAIDIGLHLKQKSPSGHKSPSNRKIWFQLKGIHRTTLTLDDFAKADDVMLDLKIEHLRFWYASPEAVYLVVYIECTDKFLAEDIRDIVDRQWGESIFYPETFREGQQDTRVRILKSALLNDDVWQRMLRHRSLRIDGPTFRGRPLGHRLDPLRCVPNKMEPSVFTEAVNRLLGVHGYKVTELIDTSQLFPNSSASEDVASLSIGVMCYTYEWILQMMTQFSFGADYDCRTEGDIFHVQGPCAVLIHSNKMSRPNQEEVKRLAYKLVETKGVRQLLVFVNEYDDPVYFGSFFGIVRGTGLECLPQFLGDLAFNLLVATTVYLEFRDKITWRIVNYLY